MEKDQRNLRLHQGSSSVQFCFQKGIWSVLETEEPKGHPRSSHSFLLGFVWKKHWYHLSVLIYIFRVMCDQERMRTFLSQKPKLSHSSL